MAENGNSEFDRRTVSRARGAVSGCFVVFGTVIGTWFVHIPVVAARLHLDPAILGLALLSSGIGAVISQPLAGWLIGRVGSKVATAGFILAFAAVFPLPIIAWATPVLFVGAFLLGVAGGAANVAQNTQASEVEAARGRPTMSSFHGEAPSVSPRCHLPIIAVW